MRYKSHLQQIVSLFLILIIFAVSLGSVEAYSVLLSHNGISQFHIQSNTSYHELDIWSENSNLTINEKSISSEIFSSRTTSPSSNIKLLTLLSILFLLPIIIKYLIYYEASASNNLLFTSHYIISYIHNLDGQKK